MRAFHAGLLGCAVLSLLACSSAPETFQARSGYPPDPWVKGYANPDDCLGGEALAARNIPLPDYPKAALKRGNQGWVIIKLDVRSDGAVSNVRTERSVPENVFEKNTEKTVKTWSFAPPKSGELQNCRILFRYRWGVVSLA